MSQVASISSLSLAVSSYLQLSPAASTEARIIPASVHAHAQVGSRVYFQVRKPWTREEDDIVIDGVSMLGHKWCARNA